MSDIRGGLDTSVLVRLLTGQPETLSRAAFTFLEETQAKRRRLLVSDLVVAEAYYACQHHYSMPKSDVLRGLHQLLSQPIFSMRKAILDLLSQSNLASTRPGFIDRLIHAEYGAQNITLITFEKSASRLANSKVLSV